MSTIEPVTVGGWYENADGSVSRYTWRSGRLHKDETVESWADVPVELEVRTTVIQPGLERYWLAVLGRDAMIETDDLDATLKELGAREADPIGGMYVASGKAVRGHRGYRDYSALLTEALRPRR